MMKESPEPGHVWMDVGDTGPSRVMCPYTLIWVGVRNYVWTALRTLADGRVQIIEYDTEDVERWYWTRQLPELKRII